MSGGLLHTSSQNKLPAFTICQIWDPYLNESGIFVLKEKALNLKGSNIMAHYNLEQFTIISNLGL